MLRQDRSFDAWLLMAGTKMSDKPSFARYSYSVSLDQFERFGRSSSRCVSRPQPYLTWDSLTQIRTALTLNVLSTCKLSYLFGHPSRGINEQLRIGTHLGKVTSRINSHLVNKHQKKVGSDTVGFRV